MTLPKKITPQAAAKKYFPPKSSKFGLFSSQLAKNVNDLMGFIINFLPLPNGVPYTFAVTTKIRKDN
jgi:hypothetical protein